MIIIIIQIIQKIQIQIIKTKITHKKKYKTLIKKNYNDTETPIENYYSIKNK